MTEEIVFNAGSGKACGNRRSGKWPAFRKQFLKGKSCAVCGGTKTLEAHHIIPFHVAPEKELDINNLLPLCEGQKTILCHLIIGHGGDYSNITKTSIKDAKHLNNLMTKRQIPKK